jgi:hypothetical protein
MQSRYRGDLWVRSHSRYRQHTHEISLSAFEKWKEMILEVGLGVAAIDHIADGFERDGSCVKETTVLLDFWLNDGSETAVTFESYIRALSILLMANTHGREQTELALANMIQELKRTKVKVSWPWYVYSISYGGSY